MKTCNLSVPVLGVLLTLTTMTALSGETGAHVPDTAAARAAADVIARAERAVTTYVDACVARDAQTLNRVTTRDARVEYTLEDPGTYLSMDASSLIAACAANTPTGKPGSVAANFWIFPTNDADTVFVQYDAPSGTDSVSHRQLALVEMRGDRISRMLNFAAMPPAVVASTLRAATASSEGKAAFDNYCRTCHSIRRGDHRLGPSLHAVFGSEATRVRGDTSSAQAKIVWDEATLDRFIADPETVVSNSNMKPYQGIADPAVRRQIIEYLKSNRDLQSRN